MTISDHDRYTLHQRLDAVLGPEEAAVLMAYLPPVGWADVATKRDLDHLALAIRSELAKVDAAVRSNLKDEVGSIRADIAGLRSDTLKEIGDLRGEIGRQMPTILIGMFGLQISGAAIVLAVSRLL
jgi:hypothetical protein